MRSTLEYPAVREAPEHVLRGLRTVDPDAELLYWGLRPDEQAKEPTLRSVWVLGTVRRTRTRLLAGIRLMEAQERLGPRGDRDAWQIGKLLSQGFATVAFYPTDVPTWAVVHDFQKRDWLYRFAFDEEFERSADVSEGLPQLEQRIKYLTDRNDSEGRDIWRYTFGKRRSYAVN